MVWGSPKPPCSSQAWLACAAERGHAHLLFLARSASFLPRFAYVSDTKLNQIRWFLPSALCFQPP